ncbi:hypothetical protein PHMEG_00020288 [Phytophthora megakarya]|uniref:Uncharacterized protein n=1 Tax=Phytophthora megakarya TaxID=4795 RepID=A0A225VR90_9STRA|nr:hypothetical protein PHMEG_00020288 [Phytophthora megakarya]
MPSTENNSGKHKSFEHPLTDGMISGATNQAKKTCVQDYTANFKRRNEDVAKIMAAGVVIAESSDVREIKCNSDVLRVQFPALDRHFGLTLNDTSKPDALQQELLCGSAREQYPGSVYDLRNLVRIRAHADGLRGVNLSNRFVVMSSSESSACEEEEKIPPKQKSEYDNDLMHVFFRDDRVLFHAKRRCFKGTVRRRIPKSDFYNIRADNGSLCEAVLASKMTLLDEPEEPPHYCYARGDKVLWVPDIKDLVTTTHSTTKRQGRSHSDANELTYKAKIVQVRSLERFDLLLRTGRVVMKVPYDEIRPRDVSGFVSTSVSTHR